MGQGRLILFTGLAGDHRLLRPIRIPSGPTITPDHLEPFPGESLAHYANRVVEQYRLGPDDVIGGASFGGMLAAEIAHQRPVAGLVLLGSCTRPKLLPRSYRWAEKLGPLIPDSLLALRSLRPLIRMRFSPITPEGEECIIQMARDCPASRIRAFARMLMRWPGATGFTCPVLSIHGDKDRIIPLRCAELGIVLANAGHAFTLTHQGQIVSAIQAFLSIRRDRQPAPGAASPLL